MKKTLCLLFTSISFLSHAEFVVKDWKLPDDKLVVLDTESQLEWLHLSVTHPRATKNTLANVWRRTQDTVVPGYEVWGNDLKGWRIASQQEIESLIRSAFPTLPINFRHFSFDYPEPTPVEVAHRDLFLSFFGLNEHSAYGAYCRETPNALPKYGDCYKFSVNDGTILGTEYPQKEQINSEGTITWLVRGEQLPPVDECPIVQTEMTRQQAIEYIQHLSSQLTDPNTTVITPLEF